MDLPQTFPSDKPSFPPLSQYRKNQTGRKIPLRPLNWFQGWGGENFRISAWVRSYGVLRPLWFPFFWKPDREYLKALEETVTVHILPGLQTDLQLAITQGWRILTKVQYNYVVLLGRLLSGLRDLDLTAEAVRKTLSGGPLRSLEGMFTALLTISLQDLIKALDRSLHTGKEGTGFSAAGRTALRELLSPGSGPCLYRLLEGLNMGLNRRCIPLKDLYDEAVDVVSPYEFDLPPALQNLLNETLVSMEKTLAFGFREERENSGVLRVLSESLSRDPHHLVEDFLPRGDSPPEGDTPFPSLVLIFLKSLLEGYGIFLSGKNRDSVASPPEELFDPGLFAKEVKDLLIQHELWGGLNFSAARVTPARYRALLAGEGLKPLPQEESLVKEAADLATLTFALLKKITAFWQGEIYEALRDRPVFDPLAKSTVPLSGHIILLESALGAFLTWLSPDLVDKTVKKLRGARKDTQKVWSDFLRMGHPERVAILEKERPATLEDK